MRVASLLLCAGLLPAILVAQEPVPDIHAELQRSSSLLQQGDGKGAEAILQRVLQRQPELATVWLRLAFCQLAQNKAAEAAVTAEKALALDKDLTEAGLLAAECWARIDPKKGVKVAKAMLEGNAELPSEARRRLLAVLVQGQEAALAQKMLDELLEAAPQDVELHRLQARLALDQNQPERALRALTAAVKLAPGDPNLADSRCQVCFALGRTEEAIAAAEHALTLDPANLTVRERLITALVKVGAGADRITLHQRYLEHYRKAAAQKAAPAGR